MTRVFWDLDLTKPWEQSSRHTKIVAVEGFEGYITAIHQAIYDEIYVENVLDFLERIQDTGTRYDLVLLLDILEHFMKEEGQRVLQLIDNISKHRIVSTPVNFYAQGAVMGNELERHLSLWKPNEIGGKEIYRDGITFVCAK
ncbi:MAG: hypothetical protein KKD44_28600 [Proteobacteria bacterium]|nr:hypothetical protein [Pseudomonadota bacterium]